MIFALYVYGQAFMSGVGWDVDVDMGYKADKPLTARWRLCFNICRIF